MQHNAREFHTGTVLENGTRAHVFIKKIYLQRFCYQYRSAASPFNRMSNMQDPQTLRPACSLCSLLIAAVPP